MSLLDGAAPGMFSREQWKTFRFAMWTVAAVVVVAFIFAPLVRGWRQREQQLSVARDDVARLSRIVSMQPAINAAAQTLEAQLALQPTRVLRARSRSLAASALQSLVQDMADASNVSVTRLDVANADGTTVGTGADIPVTLSATGDVYGMTALLQKFRQSRQVIVLDKLTVQVNSALRGAPDVLQVTLSLHAPVLVE